MDKEKARAEARQAEIDRLLKANQMIMKAERQERKRDYEKRKEY